MVWSGVCLSVGGWGREGGLAEEHLVICKEIKNGYTGFPILLEAATCKKIQAIRCLSSIEAPRVAITANTASIV